MDDCYLAKLSTKPWILTPHFNKDILEYSTTVPSQQEKITFDISTSDHGASFTILGSGGSRDVSLAEGTVTAVKIEVTSEDGHTKYYIVNVKRLSAKDAYLSDLAIKKGHLEPDFYPNVLLYYCLLPCNLTTVNIVATAPDPRNAVKVCDKANAPVPLNPGLTIIEIEVTSPDGTIKKVYKVEVAKKPIPRYVKFVDAKTLSEFECPISLSPFYCPVSIKGSNPKRTYSGPVFSEITRLSKIDPLTGEHLESDWKIQDIEVDKNMANQMAVIPLTFSVESTKPMKFGELAGILAECSQQPPMKDLAGVFSNSALSISRNLQEHKWQKALQQIFDETEVSVLLSLAENSLTLYYKNIPKPGQYHQQYAEGDSPIDALQHAIHCLATALKYKSNNAEIHFKLAMSLEEKYWAEDMYGLKKLEKSDAPSLNYKARESSKEEEVYAICKLKGVDISEPASHHLKALDNEYHHLIETGQSAKADHVMALYAWYSKKLSQEGASAHKVEDHDSPLGQAYQKYLDALCLDEVKAVYNFHVGRLLVIMGNYEDAIKRLEAALCWNAAHEQARFYLGLAISLSKEEWKKRSQEAIGFLQAGMESLLTALSKEALAAEELVAKTSLFAENLVRTSNVHFLRGIVQLGILLTKNKVQNSMAPSDIFHTAALLACQVLPNICRGDLYKQMEWVLVDAHSQLLEILVQDDVSKDFIASRCKRLSALIFHSTISGNIKLLELQEKTCQKLVKIQPCVSYSLFLLGSAQFALYEQSPDGYTAMEYLSDAKASFLASIEMEGKPCSGEAPKQLTDQKWWMRSSSSSSIKSNKQTKVGKALTAPTRSGTQLASHKGDKSKTYSPSSKRPTAAAGTAPKSHVQTASTAATSKAVPKPSGPSTLQKKDVKTEKKTETKEVVIVDNVVLNNVPLYESRLGLARVLRASKEPNEAKKYYNQVIDMAPEVHDAYIECAEMLAKTNPIEAVDVYSRFPVSEHPTFDDAFIFGEIVNILMKAEQYDDKRLATNMIAYAKVLGVGVLEKYTKILEQRYKNDVLRTIYAGIHNKPVDDPDMQAFFKFKFWI
ncbi:uncharacterized protein LOC106055386 isoform X1 [Biomphalaria glabrata]|uniref:Uncharacterized protein LOC106055386 isoform X1 n=1 Tax=Biomphalaria glabrata TaxID=6526 RepID=A0A9U8DZ38_BIOGL|nr:uncharacterized protein LOC106055386 isoform X1 [Biomphalaria glabrata]